MSLPDDPDEAIESFEDEDDFKVYKAEYEETDAFKVTTENGAIPGNYAIEVKSPRPPSWRCLRASMISLQLVCSRKVLSL